MLFVYVNSLWISIKLNFTYLPRFDLISKRIWNRDWIHWIPSNWSHSPSLLPVRCPSRSLLMRTSRHLIIYNIFQWTQHPTYHHHHLWWRRLSSGIRSAQEFPIHIQCHIRFQMISRPRKMSIRYHPFRCIQWVTTPSQRWMRLILQFLITRRVSAVIVHIPNEHRES